MFISFFYLLRQRGFEVSTNEWMTLLDGMESGLHGSTLTGFYHLCRAVLVKSEVEFDRFDQVFLEFFEDIPFKGEIPEEVMSWLNKPTQDLKKSIEELKAKAPTAVDEQMEDLLRRLEERLKEQDEEHDGGKKWVGTQGFTPWGNDGWHPNGIRIGGEGKNRTAMAVASERKFRDFRKDNKLDTRHFQMAFRTLRQLSVQNDSTDLEFDVDTTVHDTSENAGMLKVNYKKPRKNNIKVLLMMDSGGSMTPYTNLCSMLFQAATKTNHFKELHTYYFHNCIFKLLYETPRLFYRESVTTEWVLQNFDSDYRVIIVGDAAMNPNELHRRQYNWGEGTYSRSGYEWLELLKKKYPHIIWLNPEPTPEDGGNMNETHYQIAQLIDMFQLTTEGLEKAMKRLMVRR